MVTSTIKDVQDQLKLTEYDLLLIGDGSGTTIDQSSGWSCFYFDKNKFFYTILKGGCSFGTNNFAELAPYFNALWFDLYKQGNVLKMDRKVQIVSDSEITVKCGNKIYSRNCNLPLWSGINWLESIGYKLTWNHVNRNTNHISKLCDRIAGETRKMFLTNQTDSGMI